MRQQRIPTSQQPTSQTYTSAGRQYSYEVPKPGGGMGLKVVTDQTTDRVAGHGPHWEAGWAKPGPVYDGLGRIRVDSHKTKVDY